MPRHTGTPALHHDNKRKLSEPHARLHKQEPITVLAGLGQAPLAAARPSAWRTARSTRPSP